MIIEAGMGGRDGRIRENGMVHRGGGALAARAQAMISWEVWEGSQDALHG